MGRTRRAVAPPGESLRIRLHNPRSGLAMSVAVESSSRAQAVLMAM